MSSLIRKEQSITKLAMAAYVASNDTSVLSKSYDDEKISKTQRMTHDDILALGHKIFVKNNEDKECSFKEQLERLRSELQKTSEAEKQALLEEASLKANLELKKATDKEMKLRKKILEEEARKIKANMKEVAKKQVEEEHNAGELRLQEALKKAREEFDKEKDLAITKTRKEEQICSMDKTNALMKQQEENIAKLKMEAELTKKNALDELKITMDKEKKEALEILKTNMESETNKKLSHMQKEHEKEIKAKLQEIEEEKQHSEMLRQEISSQEEIQKETENRLKAILSSYQQFINSQPGFSQGQADFLLKDFLSSS